MNWPSDIFSWWVNITLFFYLTFASLLVIDQQPIHFHVAGQSIPLHCAGIMCKSVKCLVFFFS